METDFDPTRAENRDRIPLAGYILSGGRSRRFGHDKARALIHGQPLLVRIAERLQQRCETVFTVADRPDKYDDLGLTTLVDELPDHGPLAGLLTALHHAEKNRRAWILLVSCDLTELKPSWIDQLQQQATTDSAAVVFAGEPKEVGRQPLLEPFPGLYHTRLAPLLTAALDNGVHSFQQLLTTHKDVVISLSKPPDWPFVPQINTATELRDYLDQSP